MKTVLGVIIGLFVLMFLIVVHELGHFIAARRNGVTVNEFGIGFPPRAIAWAKNPEYEKWLVAKKAGKKVGKKPKKWLRLPKSEWDKKQKTLVFSVNWLPIGGFCAMDGESDDDTRKGTFGTASFWAKTKILFAGVAMNWLTAFVILTVLALTGMPKFLEGQAYLDTAEAKNFTDGFVEVASVMEDSPAEEAGFRDGDVVTAVSVDYQRNDELDKIELDNSVLVDSAQDLIDYNNEHMGEEVAYYVIRGDEVISLVANLNEAGSDYALGVSLSQKNQPLYRFSWYQAPLVGAMTTVQLTSETYKGLGQMIGGLVSGTAKQFSSDDATREEGKTAIKNAGDSVSGPVGIIGVIFPAFTEAGPTNLAFLAALIAVSLACMNVLPIPALDGGRWLLIAISRLFGKKLKKETEEKIVSYAFIFLILLIILITALDITRLF